MRFISLKRMLTIFFIFLNNLPMCRRKRHLQNSAIQLVRRATTPIGVGKRRFNLLLGLEGTLLCTSHKSWKEGDQKEITVKYGSGVTQLFYIKYRPFLNDFLNQMSLFYNLIIYTSQVAEFADPIIETIPCEFSKRYYRYKQIIICTQSCVVMRNNRCRKEILLLTNNPHNVVLVDNDEESIKANHDNSIEVSTYEGQEDNELALIQRTLEYVAREVLNREQQGQRGVTIQDVLSELQE